MKIKIVFFVLFFISVVDVKAQVTELSTSPKYKAYALFFMSTTCPLCKQYSNDITKYILKYPNISFTLIYPNKEKNKSLKKFHQQYNLNIPYIADKDHELSKKYNVAVTPEVVILDSIKNVIYQGCIDNWAIAPSVYRKIITSNYLENAIAAYLSGRIIETKFTQPIGCFLEK